MEGQRSDDVAGAQQFAAAAVNVPHADVTGQAARGQKAFVGRVKGHHPRRPRVAFQGVDTPTVRRARDVYVVVTVG